jgi:phage terminase large subunit
MSFEVTTALRKMLALKQPKKIIQGSTSSGKTYGIVPILYDKALATPRIKITIVAETLTAVKEGALDIFMRFMMDEGRWNDSQWNASSLIYTCRNGSKLQFKSFDSVGKAKASGKRQILFLNEANHIDFEIADALMIRSEEVWMDFNADMEFWAHTEVMTQPGVDFLKLTYEDNEAIPQATLNDLMHKKSKAEKEERAGIKGYWWNWWQVYGLGEIGQLQESVLPIWEQIDKKPERFQRFCYGIDFGFVHPTALIRVWYFEDEVYLEEVIYQPGLTSATLVDKMREKEIEHDVEIIADHARPEMIQELRTSGYYVLNADKSVKKGLDWLKQKTVYVHSDSINIIRENRKYKYRKIHGHVTEEVSKVDDDAIDAIRYANTWIDAFSLGEEDIGESFSIDI